MSGASDENLMTEFVGGAEKAFEVLVHRYESPLISFLYRYMGNLPDAEEIFQETFLSQDLIGFFFQKLGL